MADQQLKKIIKLLREQSIISLKPSAEYLNRITREQNPARIHITRYIEPVTIPSFFKS